jgi:hypothetical protein
MALMNAPWHVMTRAPVAAALFKQLAYELIVDPSSTKKTIRSGTPTMIVSTIAAATRIQKPAYRIPGAGPCSGPG